MEQIEPKFSGYFSWNAKLCLLFCRVLGAYASIVYRCKTSLSSSYYLPHNSDRNEARIII